MVIEQEILRVDFLVKQDRKVIPEERSDKTAKKNGNDLIFRLFLFRRGGMLMGSLSTLSILHDLTSLLPDLTGLRLVPVLMRL